ncbi:MAG: DNA polymerase III subunit gamma/tau [Acutalibacteraceae bacterium]
MYQALYRKYRPKVFKDVIGQPHVTVTLQNELLSGRIGHAYLFIGSRGTGKTTCAKIFAKAVNCMNLDEGNPCGECDLCREIDAGEVMDIVELDAASNNGVNDIRDICESAIFTPAKAKYRVYIIDEVHMLSPGAFNALLKTLEEPPAHVIFILATTEVHKIPATILSRCQRFEFHKISANDIAKRLEYVAEQENADIEKNAALLIAKISDGAMRDALAILDKCIGVSKKITVEIVSKTVGIASQEQVYEIIEAILKESPEIALAAIDNFDKHSKDMSRLTFELISNFRNIMLIKTLKSAQNLLIISDEDYKKLKDLAEKVTLETIIFIMDTLQQSFEKMSKGCDAKTELEMCLVKLCSPKLNYSNEAIVNRIDKLEREINLLKADLKTEFKENQLNVKEKENLSEKSTSKEMLAEKTDEILKRKPSSADIDVMELQKNAQKMTNWNEVLEVLKDYSHTIATAFKGSTAYISGDFVLIDSQNEMAFELLRKSNQRDKMRIAVKNVTGKAYKLGPYTGTKAEDEPEDPLNELADTAKKMGINVTEK